MTDRTTVFVGIDYDDPNIATYRGVVASFIVGDPFHRINTNDPTSDLKAMRKYLKSIGLQTYFSLSSVDNFLMEMEDD